MSAVGMVRVGGMVGVSVAREVRGDAHADAIKLANSEVHMRKDLKKRRGIAVISP
jgi:hypothetical protein